MTRQSARVLSVLDGAIALGVAALVLWIPTARLSARVPLAAPCLVLAVCSLLASWATDLWRGRLGPVMGAARLTIALMGLAVWLGEGHELWAAMAVWIARRDADEGVSAARPLAPAAIALAAVLAYSACRPGQSAGWTTAVGLVAAAAAARGARIGSLRTPHPA